MTEAKTQFNINWYFWNHKYIFLHESFTCLLVLKWVFQAPFH